MSAIANGVNSVLGMLGTPLGKFVTKVSEEAKNDEHDLSPVGPIFSNIVASCTFRPATTPAESREEFNILNRINKSLDGEEQIVDIQNPSKIKAEDSPELRSLKERALLWKAKDEELRRHQETFNPIGGMFVAGTILTIGYSIFQSISNNFMPRSMRDNSTFMLKCGFGSVYGGLGLESVQGWARITNGTTRINKRRCGE